MTTQHIRPATHSDAPAMTAIYNHYVEHSVITFEEQTIAPEEMLSRWRDIRAQSLPWLVAEDNGVVVGYAYANTWRGRCAYRFTVEVTVYLSPQSSGAGWGSALYEPLFRDLQAHGMHSAFGVIALPNPASVALHEKFSMTKVGHFREVGYKFDRWIDVGYWQVCWDKSAQKT